MNEEEALRLRLSFQRFQEIFPDEEACLRFLPTICRDCGPTEPINSAIERSFKCSKCKKINSRTAGTFFSSLGRVRPAFLLAHLIKDSIRISVNYFQKLSGIRSYDTAWHLCERMDKLCEEEMSFSLETAFDVPTQLFDEVVFRRSKLTPAKMHPRAEGEIDTELVPVEHVFDSAEEEALFQTLTSKPLHVDEVAEVTGINPTLASLLLTKMELTGVVVKLPSSQYHAKQIPKDLLSDLTGKQLGAIVDFFKFFRRFGSSRKYLQLRLARYWAVTTKVKWRARSLLNTCVQYSKYGPKKFGDYVSPLFIKMVEA